MCVCVCRNIAKGTLSLVSLGKRWAFSTVFLECQGEPRTVCH